MLLIVTRPARDAAPLEAALAARGHAALSAPLLDIRFADGVDIPLLPWQAVAITSANGARALARHSAMPRLRTKTAVVVGPASAAAASEAGFTRVEAAGGDVSSLVAWIADRLDPSAGPILYASGSITSGDLEGSLAASGFEVRRAVLYDARPAERLPEGCLAAIASGEAGGVLLFSPRTAKIWISLLRRHRLLERDGGLKHYCLSENVAAVVREALGAAAAVEIASHPEETSMLDLIGTA